VRWGDGGGPSASVLVDGMVRASIGSTVVVTSGTYQFALSLLPSEYQPGPVTRTVKTDGEVVFQKV
jgi:hypothetical protein